MGTELSKRIWGHEMPHMQSKGRHKEHVLECQTAEAVIYRIRDNTPNWMEMVYGNSIATHQLHVYHTYWNTCIDSASGAYFY